MLDPFPLYADPSGISTGNRENPGKAYGSEASVLRRDGMPVLLRRPGEGSEEPLIKCVFGSRRSFSAANSLLNLEIHTVFLRFRASL